MATYKGKDGILELNEQAVGQLRQFAINHSQAELDSTVMGDQWSRVEGGHQSWDGSATVLFDQEDLGQQEIALTGAKVSVSFYPAGTGVGNLVFSGTALITAANLTVSYDGLVEYAVTFRGDGELTQATGS